MPTTTHTKLQNDILISDTSTTAYFNGKSGLKVSMDTVDYQSPPQPRKPLTKLDSIDIVDCECD